MKKLLLFLLLTGVAGAIAPAGAATWPSKPIRLIVPYVPGGSTDFISRGMGEPLGTALGKNIIVENRPGATGTIALTAVSGAQPDGYTLVTATDVIAILPFAYRKLAFDPVKSFAPISTISAQPLVVVVNPALPAKTIKEFFALTKARAGEVSFGTSGTGTAQHLTGEMIKKIIGIDMTHIPYKGGGQAITELIGGHVPAAILGSSTVLPHHRSGKLRILAVTSKKRSKALADVPTLAESGVTGMDITQWIGLLAPAGTPKEITDRLNAEVGKILNTAAMQQRFESAGFETNPSTPQELTAEIEQGMARWGKLLKELKIQPK